MFDDCCYGWRHHLRLSRIIAEIVERLKDHDADSQTREDCREMIGALARINVKPNHEAATVAGLFVRPLLEAMGDGSEAVQSGAAMCMAKVVESAATTPPLTAFQNICPRIYKLLISPSFLAKASLLRLVSSLSQVGCISDLEPSLESIHHCLASRDWETRKAAADTLTALASHSSSLIKDTTQITLALLANACSDQIPAVRESVTGALRLWKKIEVGDSSGEQLGSDGVKRCYSTLSAAPPKEQGMVKMEASDASFSQSLERRHSGSTLNHLGSSNRIQADDYGFPVNSKSHSQSQSQGGTFGGNDALVLPPAAAVSNTNNQSEGSLAALQRQLEHLGSDNLSGVKRCYSTLSTAPPKEQGVFETRGGGGVLRRFRTLEEMAARYNAIHKTQGSWSDIQRRLARRILWAHTLKACTEGNMSLAYSRALSFNDRELLIRLMKHTGPVFDRVSRETRQRILTFISQLLDDQICLDICVTWLQQMQQCPRCATR